MPPQPPFTRAEGIVCFLIAAGIDVAIGLVANLGAVLAGGLLNPDSYMRLVRLEEGVRAGHAVYLVARDGSGAGSLLPMPRGSSIEISNPTT